MTMLAICGDSYFSLDPDYPGASFGEHLCEKNGWELQNLARPGCSNFAICLQVDKAIELRPDFVILGASSPDRIEIPIEDKYDSVFDQFGNEIYRSKYEKLRGLSNVQYRRHNSNAQDFLQDPSIVSDVIRNILESTTYRFDVTRDQIQALKIYVTYLYDYNIKRQYDSWIISDACRRLMQAGIPFLFFYEYLYNFYSTRTFAKEFVKDINWIPEKNLVDPNEFSFIRDLSSPNNAGFHYCEKNDGKTWAEFIQRKYDIIQESKS